VKYLAKKEISIVARLLYRGFDILAFKLKSAVQQHDMVQEALELSQTKVTNMYLLFKSWFHSQEHKHRSSPVLTPIAASKHLFDADSLTTPMTA
jgi:hypothetical protein